MKMIFNEDILILNPTLPDQSTPAPAIAAMATFMHRTTKPFERRWSSRSPIANLADSCPGIIITILHPSTSHSPDPERSLIITNRGRQTNAKETAPLCSFCTSIYSSKPIHRLNPTAVVPNHHRQLMPWIDIADLKPFPISEQCQDP